MNVFARIIAGVGGVVLVVAALSSAVRTVVVPRAIGSWVTRFVFVSVRRIFDVVAHERRSFEARDRAFSFYSPVSLLLLPVAWVSLITLGFTAMFYASGVHSWREAFVVSGSSVFTLGFEVRRALPQLVLSFIEAGLGLGIIALLISYLPSIYAAFNRRETLVGMLEVRAGLPPSAAEMLVRYQRIGALDRIDKDLFPQWEVWFSDIEESHTSQPSLVFFRSPIKERNWIIAAGCILDTAAIVASTLDRGPSPESALMLRTGFFALRRLADYFDIEYDADPRPDDPISVTRREFDLLLVELRAADIAVKADLDQAWRDFVGWRVNYDRVLIVLAGFVGAPPARWITDRTTGPRHRPRVGRRRIEGRL
ncbi:MAG: hypothetical protein QOD72_2819 [Acidimicrobiaceae bacterium]|nr:hypothetical protein [Acidimicrobiaceae bacterium]